MDAERQKNWRCNWGDFRDTSTVPGTTIANNQLAGPDISILGAQVTEHSGRVIVDTGATHCMVSEEFAQK